MAGRPGPQSVFWALFSLTGRIRRKTYILGLAAVFSVWWVALSQLMSAEGNAEAVDRWLIILGLIVIASGWCLFALAVKRLHDFGFSGFWVVFLLFLIFYDAFWLGIPLFAFAAFPGSKDTNRFGPPPVS